MTQTPTQYQTSQQDDELYLREIRSIPVLTPQQELQLAQRCAQGDEEALSQMVSANLRLVVSIAREYAGKGVALQDLIQEGSIGLLAAAKRFDHTLDYRFSTYATKWIRQGVTKCLSDYANAIRIPAYTAQRLNRLKTATRELEATLGREPTHQELAEVTGISEEKIAEYLSLEPRIYPLEDALELPAEDSNASQPQQELVRRELKKTVESLLCQLTPRQEQVLRLRFGMDDGICHTHEAIGETLDISKERSRQLEKQGIARMKKLANALGLEDFLE